MSKAVHSRCRRTAPTFAALLRKARQARDPLELELPERRVVLDEAQHIKNPPTKQTASIRALRTSHRVALDSGDTTIQNIIDAIEGATNRVRISDRSFDILDPGCRRWPDVHHAQHVPRALQVRSDEGANVPTPPDNQAPLRVLRRIDIVWPDAPW